MVILALISVLILIGIDSAIKQWALLVLTKVDTIPIIENVLHLTYVENRGAAFGIMQDKKWFLLILTSIIAIGAIILLISNKLKSRLAVASVALIVAGGIGNLIDRIARGFVVDYIDFRLINFAVFNFADCCVVIGTSLLAIYILFIDGKKNPAIMDELSADDDEFPHSKNEDNNA
ncbi:MAG: signal peptidase II [Hydrogenoanaerobacterium sp.]